MLFAHGGVAPEPSLGAVLGAWPFEPLVWVLLATTTWAYLRASRRVPGWPRSRTVPFLCGLGVLAVALAGPLATYEGSLFSIHMVQHLLLTVVAPPLLLLGTPVALALRASAPPNRHRLARVLHARALKMLTHPVVTWSVLPAIMWIVHFSPLYDAALEDSLVHLGEHVLIGAAAILFWWPVVGLEPGSGNLSWPARIAYLVLAMPQQAFLGLAIYSSEGALYGHYATLNRSWGPDVVADQNAAGMIMWIAGDFVFLIALVVAVLAWMRADTREAERIDRRLDRSMHA